MPLSGFCASPGIFHQGRHAAACSGLLERVPAGGDPSGLVAPPAVIACQILWHFWLALSDRTSSSSQTVAGYVGNVGKHFSYSAIFSYMYVCFMITIIYIPYIPQRYYIQTYILQINTTVFFMRGVCTIPQTLPKKLKHSPKNINPIFSLKIYHSKNKNLGKTFPKFHRNLTAKIPCSV